MNPETYIVIPDVGVKFRSAPQQDTDNVIDALKQGYRVEKIGEQDDWMQVSHKGQSGWIGNYIKNRQA